MAIGRDVSHPATPAVKRYNQAELLRQINQYLSALGRSPLLSPKGYCHGMAVVWLQKMAEYREDWFYAVIKKIIDQPQDKLAELDHDVDVLKFISQIEFAQNVNIISTRRIRQIDVDKVLETPHEYYKVDYFSVKSLAKFIEQHAAERAAFVLGAPDSLHDVAIYCRDNQYHVFDANFDSGEAKSYDLAHEATYEMSNCLFRDFGLPCLQWMTLRIVAVSPVAVPRPTPVQLTGQTMRLFTPLTLLESTIEERVERVAELK